MIRSMIVGSIHIGGRKVGNTIHTRFIRSDRDWQLAIGEQSGLARAREQSRFYPERKPIKFLVSWNQNQDSIRIRIRSINYRPTVFYCSFFEYLFENRMEDKLAF